MKPTEPAVAECRIPIIAVRLLRGPVRRAVKSAAPSYGVRVDIDEDYGLLEGVTTITARGESAMVRAFARAIQEWVEENGR